jgi:hypothetical protein
LQRDSFAKRVEEFLLKLNRLTFGTQDFLFVFLKLRGDKPFVVLQCLLADIIRRNLFRLDGGTLKVVSEDLVESDLQVRNAGPLDLFGLISSDPVLATASQIAPLVELNMIAFADHATVTG